MHLMYSVILVFLDAQTYPLHEIRQKEKQFAVLQIRPRLLHAPRLGRQIRLPLAVFTRVAAAEGPGGGDLDTRGGGLGGGGLEGLEEFDSGLGGQILVVVVVDLDHGGVDAGAEAFDLDEGEETVLGGLALLDAEVVGDGLDDGVGAAAAELARCLKRC